MPRPPKPWFRFYSELLESRKAQALGMENPRLFFRWVNLLCLANVGKPRGYLPEIEDISFALRCQIGEIERDLEELIGLHFVDMRKGGRTRHRYYMHDWEEWQKESDVRHSNADETTTKLQQNYGGSAPDKVPFRTPRSDQRREKRGEAEEEEITRAPGEQSPEEDNSLGQFIRETWGRKPTAYEVKRFEAMAEPDQYGEECVRHSIEAAAEANVKTLRYTEGICRSHKELGCYAGKRGTGGAQAAPGPVPEVAEITRYAIRPYRILDPYGAGDSPAAQSPSSPESRLERR